MKMIVIIETTIAIIITIITIIETTMAIIITIIIIIITVLIKTALTRLKFFS